MKVYIGPYKNWIGPYQIAEALCFWAKPVEDEYGYKRKPDWVHNFGTWLSHGTTKEEIVESKNAPETWLLKLCRWIESKRNRRSYIKIDKYDTWSMDHTLAMIVLPMLKQLKATKHGSPNVDDEDVPEELKSTSAPTKENEWATDDNWFKRWDWVMDEMIWSFAQKLDIDHDAQFYSGTHDVQFIKSKEYPFHSQMIRGPNDTFKIDMEGLDKHEARIQNGFRLFGKYYQALWD